MNKGNHLPSIVDSFAVSNKTVVPPGCAVVDTAAALGCAGDGALDDFIKAFSVVDNREIKGMTFNDVTSSAPSVSDELQWLPIGLNGRSAKMALHTLSKSHWAQSLIWRTRMVLTLPSRPLAKGEWTFDAECSKLDGEEQTT